ncbi:hypothetical protein RND71_030037 [Anisodus tanguticus]|uniref:Leucine-rich repeat-containing N-terminal plant-type domain-containing protein n=1 Tax=Anisodus tanguticus TaxID=243964 RepID=A0AAE1V6X7_9SOLA|nr:hypothetical protein RND71_030037 [Anisodus tanguticus]
MIDFAEYGTGAKVSVLGDIDSFRILILEIFTGKRPTDTSFQESFSLHHFVKRSLPKGVVELLDKTALDCEMPGTGTKGEECWTNLNKEQVECLFSILEIGVACSVESPKDRLTMRQVYSKLILIAATILGNETDKLALLGFKSCITEDPSRVLTSWNNSVHFCRWTGVKCDLRQERVISLNLKGLRLAGTVSGHLGNLSLLNSLDLAENSFHDEIPQELSKLSRIQYLNLSLSNRGNSS